MSNEEHIPEHKELAAALRMAKARRVKLEAQMFAQNKPRDCMGVEASPEWLKAGERERSLAGQLAQMRSDARDELGELARAASAGGKLDHKRVQELNTIITESWNDMMTI